MLPIAIRASLLAFFLAKDINASRLLMQWAGDSLKERNRVNSNHYTKKKSNEKALVSGV